MEISAPSDAIAATASIDVLLSTIQTLDKSLDDYEQVLAERADSLTSLTGGQDTEEYGLKQLEKQIDAEQMTTRTALQTDSLCLTWRICRPFRPLPILAD